MPACSSNLVADVNHLERIQRSAGILYLPYEERLQRRLLRADLVTTFKIFSGLLMGIQTYFFSPQLDVA